MSVSVQTTWFFAAAYLTHRHGGLPVHFKLLKVRTVLDRQCAEHPAVPTCSYPERTNDHRWQTISAIHSQPDNALVTTTQCCTALLTHTHPTICLTLRIWNHTKQSWSTRIQATPPHSHFLFSLPTQEGAQLQVHMEEVGQVEGVVHWELQYSE